MIYEIKREIEAELQAKGVPLPVVYGPERSGSGELAALATVPRIVFQRDRDKGDELAAGRARTSNPKMIGVRAMGAVCRVYAQSTDVGAALHDHERQADQVVDAITVALEKVVKLRKTLYRVSSAKLLSETDLALRGLEQWPGAVYELRFSVDRGVFDTTWTGDAKPEVALGADVKIKNTTKARLAGTPTDAPTDTACGA